MSVHLEYDEPVLGYHRIVAELAAARAPIGATVVDLGCGPGQILAELENRRPDLALIGVDGDDECLRRAGRRAPGAELVRADLTRPSELAGIDRSVDVVLSSHALEHLPAPVSAMAGWAGLLGPGGCLVVAVPNSLQPIMLARSLVGRPKANAGHFYIWDRATFDNFCRLAGFRIVDRALDYVPLVPVRVRRRVPGLAGLERALLRPLPQFANSHIVVLEPTEATGSVPLPSEPLRLGA